MKNYQPLKKLLHTASPRAIMFSWVGNFPYTMDKILYVYNTFLYGHMAAICHFILACYSSIRSYMSDIKQYYPLPCMCTSILVYSLHTKSLSHQYLHHILLKINTFYVRFHTLTWNVMVVWEVIENFKMHFLKMSHSSSACYTNCGSYHMQLYDHPKIG